MTPTEYQQQAAAFIKGGEKQDQLDNFVFGLIGEWGEVTGMLKKVIWHDHNLELDKLWYELGDCLWYVAAICTVHHFDFAEVVADGAKGITSEGMSDWEQAIIGAIKMGAVAIGEYVVIFEDGGNKGRGVNCITNQSLVLGALARYVTAVLTIAMVNGLALDDILDANIRKLSARDRDGKFDVGASKGRVV